MTRAPRPRPLLPLFLSALLLASCATSPSLHSREGTGTDEAISCDDADADQCVVPACDEGECAFFDCADVDSEALTQGPLAHGAELARFPRPAFRAQAITATGDARGFGRTHDPG